MSKTANAMAGAAARGGFTRRRFLQTFTGGIAVLWFVDAGELYAQEAGESGRAGRGGRGGGQARPQDLAAWLQISGDGRVLVFTGKAEVGQNIRTSLTQAIAEELSTPLASITLVMADTSLVPWDAGTFGSRTTPDMNLQLRKVAATAREALLDLAAKRANLQFRTADPATRQTLMLRRDKLIVADGRVVDTTTQHSIGIGEVTQGEKLVVNVSDHIVLKSPTAWTIAGTSVPKVNGRSYITGQHAYASDIQRPNLVHGRVLRPAAFEADLTSLDSSAAEAMPGVNVVREGNFVGVTAPNEQLAARAVAALRAEWKTKPQVSERELFAHLKSTARGAPAEAPKENSADVFRQSYTVAYIAHTPLEPRAAVAEWQGEQLTVWTGSQRPFGVRDELASAFHLPAERVRAIVPDTGSGYGGKHTGEAALEAARLAKAAGRPVKLVWTREEEFTWAYFRPAGLIEIASRARPDGVLTSWAHHNYNSGNAGLRALYDVADRQEEFHPANSPLRQGSYRALAATANHFARETHIDEVARMLRLDPLEFRIRNLRDSRARVVLEAAANRFGWNKNSSRGAEGVRGCGIAFGFDKGGYVATCAEVAIDRASGRVAVRRVVQAFDCGAIINPDHLRNQNEGAIVQGLGGALFEAIRFENGRILNPHLAQYRVPRFSDAPQIDVVLLDRKDIPPAGAGEAPIIGIAPAIGNAICDATGIRLRSLPLVPNGLKV
jgi:CO/xanthine dehydrogenase Mo-binding subunit